MGEVMGEVMGEAMLAIEPPPCEAGSLILTLTRWPTASHPGSTRIHLCIAHLWMGCGRIHNHFIDNCRTTGRPT